MPLTYVLDEHLRRHLWSAIRKHNSASVFTIDVARVGDSIELPLGSTDLELLRWAEKENRIVVTRDRNTIPTHLRAHLQAGHRSAGVFILRRQAKVEQIVDHLVLAAYAADPLTFQDRYDFIP